MSPPSVSPPSLFEEDEWYLLLAYKHVAGERAELEYGLAPTSPTEGYSHIWLNDMGLNASFVDSVRFYCTSDSHDRVIHFSANNTWVKSAIENGSLSGNRLEYWTTGTTKLANHSAVLPDGACETRDYDNVFGLTQVPFWCSASSHWAIGFKDPTWQRFECDDYNGNDEGGANVTTLHQIWFKNSTKL